MPPQPPFASWCARIHSLGARAARARAAASTGCGRATLQRPGRAPRKKLRQVNQLAAAAESRGPRGVGGASHSSLDAALRRRCAMRGCFAISTVSGTTVLARPARHRVDVEREPRRQQDQLDRHRRQAPPRELAEVGEEGAREDARAARGRRARRMNSRARAQRRLVGRQAGELQREVRLDRGRSGAPDRRGRAASCRRRSASPACARRCAARRSGVAAP